MDYSKRLSISYYKTIAPLNEDHQVYLVKHIETGKIYVKKQLSIYNKDVYTFLYNNPTLGIPTIREIYEEDNNLTVIEDYVSGISLEEIIDSKGLSTKLITSYILELCHILEPLHKQNPPIVHRDIKPTNIIITEHNHVFLLDFNAAKYYTNPKENDTVLLGTKGYAAPEQYEFGSSSPKTDIYSLGILLKEMVDSISENAPLETPHSHNTPGILRSFKSIIEKATQINPADRYESVTALQKAIAVNNNVNTNMPTNSNPVKNSLLPPGYRTKTPWKMFYATCAYIFLFWMCLSLNFTSNDSNTPAKGTVLWIERIFMLMIFLSFILITFNYRDLQKLMPLCQSKRKIIRYLGVAILNFIVAFTLFIIMALILLLLSN